MIYFFWGGFPAQTFIFFGIDHSSAVTSLNASTVTQPNPPPQEALIAASLLPTRPVASASS